MFKTNSPHPKSETGDIKSYGNPRRKGITKYKMAEVKLNLVMLELTKKCNLLCSYCYANTNKILENELTTSEILRFLDYLRKHNINNITFTGGEAFIRNDFFRILEYANNLGLNIIIFTNATLINFKIAKKLKRFNIQSIQVSIDGSTAKTHDKIRGVGGSFEKTIKAIRSLKKENFNLTLMTTIVNENINDIINVSKLCGKLGIKNWYLNTYIPAGKGKNLKEIDFKKYLEIMKELGGSAPSICNTTACGIGYNKIAILSNGDITPCEVMQDKAIGNIRKNDLLEIFYNHPLMQRLRKSIVENISECKNCIARRYCRGGCKASVLYRTGDFFKPDIANCISHKLRLGE